jgi:hypothetical protein
MRAAAAVLSLLAVVSGCTGLVTDVDAPHDDALPSRTLEGQALRSALHDGEIARAPIGFRRIALSWEGDAADGFELSTSADGQSWSRWRQPVVLHTELEAGGLFVGEVVAAGGAITSHYRLRPARGAEPRRVRLEFLARDLDAGMETGDEVVELVAAIDPARRLRLAGLTIEARASWNPRPASCSGSHEPRMLTLHHTDTPNDDSATPQARLRAIQAYHQDTRGWCDIGYHFLISQDGRVWEGRPHGQIGAHVENRNSGNVGIALLGNFEAARPTPAQLDSATRLVAALGRELGIPLDAEHVNGHGEFKSTDCPGAAISRELATIIATARGDGGGGGGDDGPLPGGVEALCQASVAGTMRSVESEYLPQVVACENGNADLEALKAQAVAARSYLYYEIARVGEVDDGQSDQVFTCGRAAGPLHRQAVEETTGQILRFRGTTVAGFYVAGALQDGPSCRGGTSDPTSTERFVTYNDGRQGSAVEQTSLGSLDPAVHANRGCMSQNGSDCLSRQGRGYGDILRFYYGADIELVQAEGVCVGELPGDGGEPTVVRVRGKVFRHGTPTEGIAGATVEVGPHTVVADAAGDFALEVPAGRYGIRASAPGFVPSTIIRELRDAVAWASVGLSPESPDGKGDAGLQGVVYAGRDTGARLVGAVVDLGDGRTAVSNQHGYFKFVGLGAGSYTVTARAAGYQAGSVVRAAHDGAVMWANVSLSPGDGGAPPPPPPGRSPCAGFCGFDDAVPGAVECFCDDRCAEFGDCCEGYELECAGAPSPRGGSCVGHCGEDASVPGSSPACYCEPSCKEWGDCCDDFVAVCMP